MKIDISDYYNYRLCFVESSQFSGENMTLYFTGLPLEKQWGDDWDDSPYEHNAEPPYEDEIKTFKIKIIDPMYPSITTPRTHVDNSPYSVENINNKVVPWLIIEKDSEKEFITAGTKLSEILKIFNRYNINNLFIGCDLGDIGDII